MCIKSIICGVLFAPRAITFYEGNNMLSALLCFFGPYAMDRNNYIEIHPTQVQVANISYHHPSKYLTQNVSPQLQYLLFLIMCLLSEKWVCKQVLNDRNLLCSLECKKTFWSFDDNVKSSVITEKDNKTKFEILLTFDPSPEILIFILSVSGFTWYLMYRIRSLSRLTDAPGISPGIISKWYKLLISFWH
jgi:hypothetical protein